MNYVKPVFSEQDGKRSIALSLAARPFETGKTAEELQGMQVGVRPEHIRATNEPLSADSVGAELRQKWIVVGGQYLLTAAIGGDVFRVKVSPAVGESIHEHFFCTVQRDRFIFYDRDGMRTEL